MKGLGSKGGIWTLGLVLACTIPAESEAQDVRGGGSAVLVRPELPPPDNACGNAYLSPKIFSAEPVSPPALNPDGSAPPNWDHHHARLSRNGIHYVSTNFVRVNVVTDPCTYIVSVRVGSRTLTTTYDEGYWYTAQPSDPQPSEPGRSGQDVTIFYPGLADGATDIVTVRIGREGGRRTNQYTFPLVHVQAVEARDEGVSIGISGAEVVNMFSSALYKKFNGPSNRAVIGEREVYGYDPDSLGVSVTATGISFQFKFKVEVPYYCDPTVLAYGTFRIDTDPFSGLTLAWVNPVDASLTWPSLCAAGEVIPIINVLQQLAYEVFDARGEARSSVMAAVEASVTGSLEGSGGATLFLAGSRTRKNELLIDFANFNAPSVTIQVPYDAFDQPRNPTAFAPDDLLTLFASGLGMYDQVAGVGSTDILWSGPNGVPLAGTTTWPNPQAVARSEQLAWDGPVATLLARTAPGGAFGETLHHYTAGCSVTARSGLPAGGPAWIHFGVNDTASDAQRLRAGFASGYQVRVMFAKNTVLESATPCFSSSPVPVPADYDNDGRADLAVKDNGGVWRIDYAANGLGGWDAAYPGYGDINAVAVPADYDGDGRTDLSVKSNDGRWHIDYASNGLGSWNEIRPGYGDSSGVPVPADYDGDRRADLSVKDSAGNWYIDYASNGFGAWNEIRPGYGDSSGAPVPADYDGDGRADLSIKDSAGNWYIDYAVDGFGAWNEIRPGYGADSVPVPADYDGDRRADLSVTNAPVSVWYVDFATDGFGTWNEVALLPR